MPLPNYGYFNKEEKKHQDLVFEMAPQYVDVDDGNDVSRPTFGSANAKEASNLHKMRAQVTTGKIGIDLERKLVINDEKDPDVWRPPKIDEDEVREAKKYATPERKDYRRQVRASIDSLISGKKAKEIKNGDNDQKAPGLGLYLGGSTGDYSSPPTTPVRKNFSSKSSEASSRASPFNSSGYSSYADSNLGDIAIPAAAASSSSTSSSSFVQQSSSFYAASSSTSSYSSSSLRSPTTSGGGGADNKIQDYRRQSDNRLQNFSSPTVDNFRGRGRPGQEESFVQKRSTSSSMVSTERLIPVRRQ